MADDGFFTANTNWQAVELDGIDVSAGTFSIFSLSNKRVGFIKSVSVPTDQNGVSFINDLKDSLPYILATNEKLYCKTDVGTAEFGVMNTTEEPLNFYDYFSAVNQGLVDGQEMVHKFGFSSAITSAQHHIWNVPTNVDLVWQTVASVYDVVSDDVDDTFLGTGARTVWLEGLDANFNTITETVELDGTTPVTTDASFIRLQRAKVMTCGAYTGSNEGDITIQVTGGGDIQGYIEKAPTHGEAQTQKSQYTVPAGKTAYIKAVNITMDSGKSVTLDLHAREGADIIAAPFKAAIVKHQWDGLDTPISQEFKANHIFPEKTDIWFDGSVSTGSAIIEVDYDILLVDN